jgi:triacylglycerol esterase/lipase EstA (alpha/beta hydrolase family)
MKTYHIYRFLGISAFIILSFSNLWAQRDRPVVFMHGLNDGTNGVWNETAPILLNVFRITETRPNYNSNQPIPSIANQMNPNFSQASTVAVCHSMGGLVAREIIRNGGNRANINALITIGTAHLGAPFINQIPNSGRVFAQWLKEITAGPIRQVNYAWGIQFGNRVFSSLGLNVLQPFINTQFGTGAALNDLRPNSAFLQTLNANTSTSTIPQNTYSIWAKEDWNHHIRLGESAWSFISPNRVERNILAGTGYAFQGFYGYMFLRNLYLANTYYQYFFYSGNFSTYTRHIFASIGRRAGM